MLDKFMVTKGRWVWRRMEVAERRFAGESVVMEPFMLDKFMVTKGRWVWRRMSHQCQRHHC